MALRGMLELTFVWVNTREFAKTAPDVSIPDEIEVRIARLEDCLHAVMDPQMGLTEPFVRTAFAQEALCHAAFVENQMVAYAWRSQSSAPHNKWVGVQVEQGLSYGFKAHTHPNFRGLGLYAAITAAEYETAQKRELRSGVSFTQWRNTPSINADRRLGNRRVGIAGIIRMGSLVYCLHSPGAKAAGFRFIPLADMTDWPWPR